MTLIRGICYTDFAVEEQEKLRGIKKLAKKVQVQNYEEEAVDVNKLVQELKAVNAQAAQLKKKDALLKAQIATAYFTKTVTDEETGEEVVVPKVPVDNRGSSFFETIGADGKPLILKRGARISMTINKELATAFFQDADLYEQVTDTVVEFNEDAIAQLIMDEVISLEDFESVCDKKTTYAYSFVKAIEEEDATSN